MVHSNPPTAPPKRLRGWCNLSYVLCFAIGAACSAVWWSARSFTMQKAWTERVQCFAEPQSCDPCSVAAQELLFAAPRRVVGIAALPAARDAFVSRFEAATRTRASLFERDAVHSWTRSGIVVFPSWEQARASVLLLEPYAAIFVIEHPMLMIFGVETWVRRLHETVVASRQGVKTLLVRAEDLEVDAERTMERVLEFVRPAFQNGTIPYSSSRSCVSRDVVQHSFVLEKPRVFQASQAACDALSPAISSMWDLTPWCPSPPREGAGGR